jgi:hypothetical protein
MDASAKSSRVVRNQYRQLRSYLFCCALLCAFLLSGTNSVHAITASVAYQPMVSNGLAAGQPFEAWIILDKSLEPSTPGYALPAGATMRFRFPKAFNPILAVKPEAVLLFGWPQRGIPVKFQVALDPQDARTIVITLLQPLEAAPPDSPGLKAIHLRTGERNPKPGSYPIEIQFTNAGELSGTATALASIAKSPVPVIAPYNQLHESRNEDWQHVKRGQAAPLPIDLLVNLPHEPRSSISLRPTANGGLEILSDEKPIGTITTHGPQLSLTPVAFGPGFARLGIVRFRVSAGAESGTAEISAQLTGGPTCTLHVIVEP